MAQTKIAPNERLTLRPPVGMHDLADPGEFTESRAALLFGLAVRSPGVLERVADYNTLYTDPSVNIQGTFQYLADNPANDKLLIVKNNALYTAPLTSGQPNTTFEPDCLNPYLSATPTGAAAVPALVTNNSGVALSGTRYRFAQVGSEAFFVPKEGGACVKFDGTNLYKCGITKPITVVVSIVIGVPSSLNGTYHYVTTYVDAKGRESSPSPVDNQGITISAGIHSIDVTLTASADAQVAGIYLYRALGSGLYYRVQQGAFANANATFRDKADGTNGATDTLIIFNTLAPNQFENEVPNPASVIREWKGHLVLNDTTDPRTYQLSNVNLGTSGPTQFSLNGTLGLATDGITKRASDSWGSAVVAFLPMGSALGIGLTRGWRLLVGDRPSNYSELPILGAKGCIATDSVAEGVNEAFFLAEDGVYGMAFATGFVARKLSSDLDGQFRGVAAPVYAFGASYIDFPGVAYSNKTTLGAASMGFFCQGRYVLFGPNYIAIYNTETGGWVLDDGPGANLACGASVLLDRTYEVLLVTPAGTPKVVNTYAFYPLADKSSDYSNLPFRHFAYKTRAIDGAGQPRSDQKDVVKVAVFGEFIGGQKATDAGHIVGHLTLYLQVDSDVTKANSNPATNPGSSQAVIGWVSPPGGAAGNVYDISSDHVYAEWQMNGILAEVEFEVPSGHIIQIVASGTVQGGRLYIRDIRTEYVRGAKV